jgi:hypothetical protein
MLILYKYFIKESFKNVFAIKNVFKIYIIFIKMVFS